LAVKLLSGCPAGGPYGGVDSSAGCHDFYIRFALQPHFELSGAVACPYQVGVRIDEAWKHGFSAGVQALLVRVARQ